MGCRPLTEEVEYGQCCAVDSHLPDVARLGRSDLHPARKIRDRSPYEQYAFLEVHVRPPKAAELAAPAAGRCCDEEQRGQFGILLLSSLDEELDLLGRRRIWFVPLDARGRCLRRRGVLEEAPLDAPGSGRPNTQRDSDGRW